MTVGQTMTGHNRHHIVEENINSLIVHISCYLALAREEFQVWA